MKIIGVDLHARRQAIAVLDDRTGELVKKVLPREGDHVHEFYSALPRPALVEIEPTGMRYWFLRLLKKLEIEDRVGHPATSERPNPTSRKYDRRDAC